MSFRQMPLPDAYWFQEGPGVRNWQFTDHGVKLLNVANILKSGEIDLSKTDRHLSQEEVDSRYAHFLANEGDLVIASSGITIDDDGLLRTRGAFLKASHLPLCMNTSTIRFKAIDSISDLGFLRHWLQSLEFRSQITREVTGIAQKNFGPSHLKRLKISLPPLAEQKRIAAILDAADALRAKRREALAQLDTLLQSTFLDLFGDPVTNPKGWKVVNLEEHVTKVGSGATPKGGNESYKDEGIALIRSLNVRDGEFQWKDLARIDTQQAKKLSNVVVQENDVLLNITGASVARVCSAPAEVLPARVNQHVCIIRTDASIDSKFLERMLLSDSMKHKLLGIGESGATRQAITKAQVLALEVLCPPANLQHRFASIVESIERQKTRLRAHLAELDTLFASLQARAFNGEL